jgi:lipid-A-disaccharide synthase
MKYFLVAGEASGDLHGEGLARALRTKAPKAELVGWGGDKMESAGVRLLERYESLSVMGFTQVLAALPRIWRLFNQCVKQIEAEKPDILILIDYPGFNMRLAKRAKAMGIPVCYFISPKFWAWNTGRVHKIKRDVDLMLSILPFEGAIFESYGVPSVYIGNPLIDRAKAFVPNPDFRAKHSLDNRPIIAILPGSRRQELKYILEPFILGSQHLSTDYQLVVSVVPSLRSEIYQPFKDKYPHLGWVNDDTYNLLHNSVAALVCSGTATLETALLGIPQIVGYRTDHFSAWITRKVIRVPFVSLVNLIADKEVVPELLQEWLTPEVIKAHLDNLITPAGLQSQLSEYKKIHDLLGDAGVSDRAAAAIVEMWDCGC